MRTIPRSDGNHSVRVRGRLRRCFAGLAVATGAVAQPIQAQRAQLRPELRVDMIRARSTSVHGGAGLTLAGAGYARLTVVAGGGVTSFGENTEPSGRVDVVGRFVLDPYREARLGLYGYGGLSALYDRLDDWRGVLAVGIGLELPARGNGVWAIETGIGGGIRLGGALRRSGRGRR
jgi:hypothetical protein